MLLLFRILQSPTEQQAFHHAHMTGDEATKQYYHEQYFPQTLHVLQGHVDYLVDELDKAFLRIEDQSYLSSVEDEDDNYPRLPLISKHNDWVRGILELVKRNLDGMVISY